MYKRQLTYDEVVGVTLMADWSQAGLEGEDTYGATAVVYPQNGGVPQTVLTVSYTHLERVFVRKPSRFPSNLL